MPFVTRYQLAESLDAQLKRMGQDLKEIIERLNSANTKPDPDDPVSVGLTVGCGCLTVFIYVICVCVCAMGGCLCDVHV